MLPSFLLSIVLGASAPPLMGPWKPGQKWVVEYTVDEPSPMAVMDPAPRTTRRQWTHEVISLKPRTLRITSPDSDETIELVFEDKAPHALLRATITGRSAEGKPVELDRLDNEWGPGRSTLTPKNRPVLLSHPVPLADGVQRIVDTSRGYERVLTQRTEKTKAGLRITLESGGDVVQFLWKPGEPWWREAVSGPMTARRL